MARARRCTARASSASGRRSSSRRVNSQGGAAIALARTMLLAGAALAIAVVTFGVLLAGGDRDAHAQSFIVDTTADAVDTAPGDGVCAAAGGGCSLRAAVQEANALAGADAISVGAGTYTLSLAGAQESAAATGDLDIAADLTIVGAGIAATIVDAAQLDRVFEVVSEATVSISGMTMRNGRSDPNDGGAVHNAGTLTLSDVAIKSSHADDGGAIANSATATLLDSELLDNAAADGGGAIISHGALTIRRSTIATNTAAMVGGGVNSLGTLTISESLIAHNTASSGNGAGLASFAGATLTNVTFSDNSARINGGGIYGEGSLALTNVTISGNTADVAAGGVSSTDGTVQLRNTIIAGNQPDQCGGTGSLVSQGSNISSAEDCQLTGDGDMQNTDPMLGPLTDNGGPTETHALLSGSPAIDNGQPAGCPQVDQRGVPRSQNGLCDIGAFEVGPLPVATPTPTPIPIREVGDANCDRSVDSIDAALVLQQIAGLLGALPCQSAADANQDGSLNSIDAALILQYSAGLLTRLPP